MSTCVHGQGLVAVIVIAEASGAARADLIGAAVRAQRIARGVSQRALGQTLGVSAATISAIENGATGMSVHRATAVAEALGITVAELLSSDPAAPKTTTARAGESRAEWAVFAPLALNDPLRGALEVFTESGYHGARTRTIADRAGLSMAGVHHHYPSKQSMLIALVDAAEADIAWRFALARAEAVGYPTRFENSVRCLTLFHVHRAELGNLVTSELRSLDPASRQRVMASHAQRAHLLSDDIVQATSEGSFESAWPTDTARAVMAVCKATGLHRSPSNRYAAEHFADLNVMFSLAMAGANTRG